MNRNYIISELVKEAGVMDYVRKLITPELRGAKAASERYKAAKQEVAAVKALTTTPASVADVKVSTTAKNKDTFTRNTKAWIKRNPIKALIGAGVAGMGVGYGTKGYLDSKEQMNG